MINFSETFFQNIFRLPLIEAVSDSAKTAREGLSNRSRGWVAILYQDLIMGIKNIYFSPTDRRISSVCASQVSVIMSVKHMFVEPNCSDFRAFDSPQASIIFTTDTNVCVSESSRPDRRKFRMHAGMVGTNVTSC